MRDSETVASIRMRAEQLNTTGLSLCTGTAAGSEEWKDEEYPVRIARTSCNLGGSRAWFIYPAVGCGRRAAILYGGGIFACRHCYQLAYASTREDAGGRAIRRADRLRERLGWQPGIYNGEGDKPPWMRWRTFERIAAKHDELVANSMRAMAVRLGLFNHRQP
jgi:hypothetical protein